MPNGCLIIKCLSVRVRCREGFISPNKAASMKYDNLHSKCYYSAVL